MADIFDQAAAQPTGDIFDQAAAAQSQPSVRPSDPRTVPNARIRNLPNPVDPSWGPGRALYEGAKTGLMVGSLPAAAESTIPGLVRGAIGATLGGTGAQTISKALGAGEFGQEVAGDVGGLVGGGLTAGLPETRVGKSVSAIAKPFTTTIEDLPVIGSMVKGVKAAGNVRGELADIWGKPPDQTGTPLISKNPLGPDTPDPDLLKARNLATANTPASLPASQTGEALGQIERGSISRALNSPSRTLPGQISPEVVRPPVPTPAEPIPPREGLALPAAPKGAELGELPAPKVAPTSQADALGKVPQRGSIAEAVKPEAKPITRGSLSQMLQEQLNQSLGGKELNPKVPLRQQLDSAPAAKPSADIPEGHTPVQSSALRSYKYDPAAREFHARATSGDTTYIYGDVSPEDAANFEGAESKGKAWQAIRQNPLVGKIVNGKRISTRVSAPK